MNRLDASTRPDRPEPIRNPYFGSTQPIENEAIPAAATSGAPSLTIEPFIGHRLWNVVPGTVLGDRPERPVLRSITKVSLWEGPEAVATCLAGKTNERPHPTRAVPATGCTCGLYALKTASPPPRPWVWAEGAIALSGRVLEGTLGYRAERGRVIGPLRLLLGGTRPRCLRPLCRQPAEWMRVNAQIYLPRCTDHLQPEVNGMINLPLEEFLVNAAASFFDRYGVQLEGA